MQESTSALPAKIFANDVFLSHNQEMDVTQIAARLRAIGLTVVFDDEELIDTVEPLDQRIAEAIRNSRFIVSCQHRGHRFSEWCHFETEQAAKFEAETGIPRLIRLYVGENCTFPLRNTDYFDTDESLAELAAYASFHNHLRVDPFDYPHFKHRLVPIVLGDASCSLPQLDQRKMESFREYVSLATNITANDPDYGLRLQLLRDGLLRVGASELQNHRNYNLLVAISSIVKSAQSVTQDSGVKAEVFFLSSMLSSLCDSAADLALKLAAEESSPDILLDAYHYNHVFSAGGRKNSAVLEFIRNRAECLRNSVRARAQMRTAIAKFGPIEKALLFERVVKEIIKRPPSWTCTRMEGTVITLFCCLFTSQSPHVAKPIDLQSNEERVLSTLLAGLHALYTVSKENDGRPMLHCASLYSDYLLPVLARGINSNFGLHERFREIANYIHGELPRYRVPPKVITVFDWYINKASKEFSTTAFPEFLVKLLEAHK